jgi:AcrR family transcriptional regulator
VTTEKRQDRRVRRTKQLLGTALLSLIVEKSYDKITVQDLIDRADVGRSTFYAHYETKDDLLIAGLDHLTADIEAHLADDPSDAAAILPSLGVFRHVAEHHSLFKPLIGTRGIDLVHQAAFDAFTQRARSAIDRRAEAGEQTEIPPDARAAFAAGSLMAILAWWLDNNMPYPPEQMADIYRQMTATA